MIQVADVMFALGIALILLAWSREDMHRRYPWLR